MKAILGKQTVTVRAGEAMASNRKNKLICYWDFELELKWQCTKKVNRDDTITGKGFQISSTPSNRILKLTSNETFDFAKGATMQGGLFKKEIARQAICVSKCFNFENLRISRKA